MHGSGAEIARTQETVKADISADQGRNLELGGAVLRSESPLLFTVWTGSCKLKSTDVPVTLARTFPGPQTPAYLTKCKTREKARVPPSLQ
ncbi:unnamed protein product [Rangifer tarandus platyrhynchus]|uniref:Uncharacterized protein n=2 Tax=Rangifer tarandus platyrhynchus TaxID=3082113 RepID=A0ACB0F2X1_RANTA|nr:unnamed protein product [Rangifer tarandus platyrhynchus]CAI9707276.1 unnamed protein product [Rangifer tarandus platyrhynchus]